MHTRFKHENATPLLALMGLYAVACSSSQAQENALELETMGIMFSGGSVTEVPYACPDPEQVFCEQPGTARVGHVPTYFMIPRDQAHPLPIIMVPGFGVSSAVYLTTPDGREGWAQFFVRRGFAVYVTVQGSVVGAGFNVSRLNAVKLGEAEPSSLPDAATWTPETFWGTFGYGPEYAEPWPDLKFSEDDFEELLAYILPADISMNNAERLAPALVALLERVGPAVLLTHSSSGPGGFEAARRRPDLVKGMISIEPIGCPTEEADIRETLGPIPVLTVFADHVDSRPNWPEWSESCASAAEVIADIDGRFEHWSLPQDFRIRGNTHMMMGETNSDDIAEMLYDWLAEGVDSR